MNVVYASHSRSILVYWIDLKNHFRLVNRLGHDLEAVVGAHLFNLSLQILLFKAVTLLIMKLIYIILLGLNLFDSFLNLDVGILLSFSYLLVFLSGFDTSSSFWILFVGCSFFLGLGIIFLFLRL